MSPNPASRKPEDWTLRRRFEVASSVVPPLALLWLAGRKGWVEIHGKGLPFWVLPLAVGVGMLVPGMLVGWHRRISRLQGWVGRRLLSALLAMVFVVAVLPVGLWLRLRGRSFLEGPQGDSCWVPPRPPGSLRDQF